MDFKHDIALMAHLVRRAGFGASRLELEELAEKGYERVVDELLEPDKYGLVRANEDILFRHLPISRPGGAVNSIQANYLWQMINSQRPLEEKVALFWHQVFATSEIKLESSNEMLEQIKMFRDYGMGNYRDLLVQLGRSPAMIYWLDNNENHKDAPNENWGRELLELFSMGWGNYTEKDVFECARAFTGWTIAPKIPKIPLGYYLWEFEYRPEDHDDGEKAFLGHQGRFNGEDVIDIIVRQQATARFVVRHLYNFFVADEPQVSAWQDTPPRDPVAINILGDAFVSSGYDIRSTLRVLFHSDFFKEARFTRVKSPVEVVVGVMKLTGEFKGIPDMGLMALAGECEYMGQTPLAPPSVEGWHTGSEWIDSGALVKRINFVADRFGDLSLPGIRYLVDRVRSLGTLTPDGLLESCLDLVGPVYVGEETRQQLMAHAEKGGPLCWDGSQEVEESAGRVCSMLSLIAASREYQFG